MTTETIETPAPRAAVRPKTTQTFARFRAPFALRCGAILIDYIIVIAIIAFSTLISRVLGGGARSAGNSSETIGIVIAFLVTALNLGVLPGFTGFTIGKWAAGLRILRLDGGDIGVGRAFARHFGGYTLSFLTLGIGFLISALSSRGRGLPDLIAGTVVVREGRAVMVTRPSP